MDKELLYQQFLSNGGDASYEEVQALQSQLVIESPKAELKKKDQPTENGNPSLTNGTPPSQTDLPILTNPIPENEFMVPLGSEQDLSSPSLGITAEMPSTDLPSTATVSSGTENSNVTLPTVTQPALSNVGDTVLPITPKDYKFYQDRVSSINKEFDALKKNPLINQNKLLVESITNLDSEYKVIQDDKEYNSLTNQAKEINDKINEVGSKAIDGKLPAKEFNEYQLYKNKLDSITKNPKFVEAENKQKNILDKRNELFSQYESLQNSDEFKNIIQTQSSLIEEQKSIFGSDEYKNSVLTEKKRIADYNAGLKSSANKTTNPTFQNSNINPFARDINSTFQIGGMNLPTSTLDVLAGKSNDTQVDTAIPSNPTEINADASENNFEANQVKIDAQKSSNDFIDQYKNKDYVDAEKKFAVQPFDTYGLSDNNQQDIVALEKSGVVEIQRDESGNPILEGNQYRYKYVDKNYYDNTYVPYIDKLQREYKSQAQEQNIDSARFNFGNVGNEPEQDGFGEFVGKASKFGVLPTTEEYENLTTTEQRNEYLATAEATQNAQKNGTTFQEEYDKVIPKYALTEQVKIANGFEASNLLLGNSKWDVTKDAGEIALFENYFKDKNNVLDFGEYWSNEGKGKFGSSTIQEMQAKDQTVRAEIWNDYLSYRNDKLGTNIRFIEEAITNASALADKYTLSGAVVSAQKEIDKVRSLSEQYSNNEAGMIAISNLFTESNKNFTQYNKQKEQEAQFQLKIDNGEVGSNTKNILGQVVLGIESSVKSAVGGIARFVSVPFGEGNIKDAVDIFSDTELKIGNVKIAPLSQKVVEFKGSDGKNYKETNGITYEVSANGELKRTNYQKTNADAVTNEDTEYNWSGLTFMASKALADIYITRSLEGGINKGIVGFSDRIAKSKKIASVFGEASQLAKVSANFARLPRNVSGASVKGWTVQMFNDSYQAGERGGIKGDVNKFIYALTIAGVQAQLQRINPDINYLKSINSETQQIVRALITNNTQKALQSLQNMGIKMFNSVTRELPEEFSQQGFQDIVNVFLNFLYKNK